jgi:lipocalin
MGNSGSNPQQWQQPQQQWQQPQQQWQQPQQQWQQPQQPQPVGPESTKCVFHPQLYQGKWYEIARYVNSYESSCVQAEQRLKWKESKQEMHITNSCIDDKGQKLKIKGVGVPNKDHACQLTVKFEGVPKTGQYWVIWTDYDKWALVGNENKTAFWMLSREPYISKDDFRLLKVYAMWSGYKDDLIIPHNTIVGYKIDNEEDSKEERTNFDSDIIS